MIFLELTNSSYKAIVSDHKYNDVLKLDTTWCVIFQDDKPIMIRSTRHFSRNDGYSEPIQLGRFVMGVHNKPAKIKVDHIHGDIFDNRDEFLRLCNQRQNGMNRPKNKNNTSGYKGVGWHKRNEKWFVQLMKHGKRVYSGYFTDVIEAAKAYDKAALEHHGKFAKLNFPQ